MLQKIIKIDCLRCGHRWTPTIERIRVCPKCKNPYWDVPRKNKIKQEED